MYPAIGSLFFRRGTKYMHYAGNLNYTTVLQTVKIENTL